ncbi:hypothetical protein CROQUDRAFT_724479 [Cronartium quercuum f. sp. fusiforme G11]|uniref:PH domain-containing protein n=1 Tax=Cronartium quercuum f. sp. fusiforme G11 TaxID=708437 RepID=A0A9P6NBJ3_9BASI|nr:hypothetical protein CROQUDRAFT_724479 [Cronartium quercuum f. sp. fusiforme G11]
MNPINSTSHQNINSTLNSKRTSSLISTFSLSIISRTKRNQTNTLNLEHQQNTPSQSSSSYSPLTPRSGLLGEHTPPIQPSSLTNNTLHKPIPIQDEIERIESILPSHHHNHIFLNPFPTTIFSNHHGHHKQRNQHDQLQSPIDLPSESSLSNSSHVTPSSSNSKSIKSIKSNKSDLDHKLLSSNKFKFKKTMMKSSPNSLKNSSSNLNQDHASLCDDARSSKSCPNHQSPKFTLNHQLLWDSELCQFPTTKAALEGVIKYRGILSKHTISPQTSFWNLKSTKVWKNVFCCITAIYPHNHPELNTTTTLYNLHVFSNVIPNQSELEISRLRLGSESIVCVLEDNMAGESLVLKITGYQIDSDHKEVLSSWMFAMEGVAHLKSWMRTFKEIVNELKSAPPPVPILPPQHTLQPHSLQSSSFNISSSNSNRAQSKQTNINPKLGDRDLISTRSLNRGNRFKSTTSLSTLPEPDREINDELNALALKEAFVKSLKNNTKERDHYRNTQFDSNLHSSKNEIINKRLSSLPCPPRHRPLPPTIINPPNSIGSKPIEETNSIKSNSPEKLSDDSKSLNHHYRRMTNSSTLSSNTNTTTTTTISNRRPSDTNTTSTCSIISRLPIPRQSAPAPTVALPPLPIETE